MNKIWGFGDSFTFGHGCRLDGPTSEYCIKYKKAEDKIWLDWLGSYMNMRPINLGECACSNDTIIDTIIESWYGIQKGDIVIIGTTFSNRFDVPVNNRLDSFLWAHQYWIKNSKLPNKFKLTKEEVETIINFKYYFANHELYKQRQLRRFSFLEQRLKEKGIKCFIWNIEYYVMFDSIHTISQDTNGLIDDSHFSFKGHKEFSNIIHKKIINNINLI
jgi:hypothetical protein